MNSTCTFTLLTDRFLKHEMIGNIATPAWMECFMCLMLCYVFPVSAANAAKLLPTYIIILLSGVLKGCTVHSEKYIQVSY